MQFIYTAPRHSRRKALVGFWAIGALLCIGGGSAATQTLAVLPGLISTAVGSGTPAYGGTPGYGGDGGPGSNAELWSPMGLATDSAGNLYIADCQNNAVRRLDAATGKITTIAGVPPAYGYDGDGGLAISAHLNCPAAIAVDASGDVFIADSGNNVIREVDGGMISTVAGGGTNGLGDLGPATQASLNGPMGVAVDGQGNIYIADSWNGLIRKVDAGHTISTVAGTQGMFVTPTGLALDNTGNLYVADWGGQVIYKISTTAGCVPNNLCAIVAGNGSAGFVGNGGVAVDAELNGPWSVAVAPGGDIFISETANSDIRLVDVSGTISTIAGTPGVFGWSGDGGPATEAALNSPYGVALTTSAMYVADYANNVVREILFGSFSFTFPQTALGTTSAPKGASILNLGTSGLNVSSVALTGPFIQQQSGALDCRSSLSLGAGQQCQIALAFSPLSAGVSSGALLITSNSANPPPSVSIGLSGTGLAVPEASISTSSLTFGSQLVGSTSVAQTVVLQNQGTSDLVMDGIAISGANANEFSETNTCGHTIAAGASCSISISFIPQAIGARAATLSVQNNADSPQTVSLSGTGIGTPEPILSGTGLYFDSQSIGTTSGTQVLIMQNRGSASLAISSITITGQNASDFSEANTCGETLAAGATCSISVSFRPNVPGSRSAALTIEGNSNSSQVVSLTGRAYTLARTGDFDGDGKADFVVWRPSDGNWYILPSSGNPKPFWVRQWGLSGDIPLTGDFNGDKRSDFVVWRPSECTWYVLFSSQASSWPPSMVQQWGLAGDIPVPGDYDGDGKTDFAVWRPSIGTWYVLLSTHTSQYPAPSMQQQWGLPGDIPVPGDYDGDGKTDFAVWRPSNGTWYVIPSSNPTHPIVQQWGFSNDIPLTGDFDGDGKADFAVWRPSECNWYILPSSGFPWPFIQQQWGLPGDLPQLGDFFGEGKTSFAIWRPSNASWFVLDPNHPATYPAPSLFTQWGFSDDIPM